MIRFAPEPKIYICTLKDGQVRQRCYRSTFVW